jgi:hypothetical protein
MSELEVTEESKVEEELNVEKELKVEEELIKDVEPTLIDILRNINWQKFYELCSSLGTQFNDPQWRFLKAVFLEKAIACYSNNELIYVGNEEKGCDFIIPLLNNLKIEMKYTTDALFGGKQLTLRKKSKPITLLNSKGTNKHINLPDNYSDYLMIVEMKGAGLISKNKLKQYVISNGDSLTATIPTDELIILFTPTDINMNLLEVKKIDIKQQILSNMINIINSI